MAVKKHDMLENDIIKITIMFYNGDDCLVPELVLLVLQIDHKPIPVPIILLCMIHTAEYKEEHN